MASQTYPKPPIVPGVSASRSPLAAPKATAASSTRNSLGGGSPAHSWAQNTPASAPGSYTRGTVNVTSAAAAAAAAATVSAAAARMDPSRPITPRIGTPTAAGGTWSRSVSVSRGVAGNRWQTPPPLPSFRNPSPSSFRKYTASSDVGYSASTPNFAPQWQTRSSMVALDPKALPPSYSTTQCGGAQPPRSQWRNNYYPSSPAATELAMSARTGSPLMTAATNTMSTTSNWSFNNGGAMTPVRAPVGGNASNVRSLSPSAMFATSQQQGGMFATNQGTMFATNQQQVGMFTSGYLTTTTGQMKVDENTVILNEKVIERSVKVPKKIIVEDVVEKIIVVPEKRIREEITEETARVVEKIVEVAKPVVQETFIEVPEVEYVEKIVEVPEIVLQEKIREVLKVEIQEKIVEVPRIYTQEKIVEVPEIEYREYHVEKVVEVPEVREQVVLKEVPVPQYVDKPYAEYVTVEETTEVERKIPVPLEVVTTFEFVLPQLRQHWKSVDIPLYVPRFVEIGVPMEAMDLATAQQAEHYAQQVAMIGVQTATSLCELETLARSVKGADFTRTLSQQKMDVGENIKESWRAGMFAVSGTHTSKPTATDSTSSGQQELPKSELSPKASPSVESAEHSFGEQQVRTTAWQIHAERVAAGVGSFHQSEGEGATKSSVSGAGSDLGESFSNVKNRKRETSQTDVNRKGRKAEKNGKGSTSRNGSAVNKAKAHSRKVAEAVNSGTVTKEAAEELSAPSAATDPEEGEAVIQRSASKKSETNNVWESRLKSSGKTANFGSKDSVQSQNEVPPDSVEPAASEPVESDELVSQPTTPQPK